jgi:hypothetical protein
MFFTHMYLKAILSGLTYSLEGEAVNSRILKV